MLTSRLQSDRMRGFSLILGLLAIGCARSEEKTSAPSPGPSPSSIATAALQPSPARDDPSPPARCEAAKKVLRDFVATFPATCAESTDCDGYFLLEDTCAGPTVLRVPGCPPEKKPLLFAYQHDVRKSCPPAAVCPPGAYRAACDAGRCVDSLERSLSR